MAPNETEQHSTKKPKRSFFQKLRRKHKREKSDQPAPKLIFTTHSGATVEPRRELVESIDNRLEEQRKSEVEREGKAGSKLLKLPLRRQKSLSTSSQAPPSLKENIPRCTCRHGSTGPYVESPQYPGSADQGFSCINCGRCPICASDDFARPDTRCRFCKSKAPFLSLPVEVLQHMSSYLCTNSTWLLRLTCKAMFNTICAPADVRVGSEIHDFFHLIRDLVPRNLYYCYECLRYHPWTRDDYYLWGSEPRCLRNLDRKGEFSRAYLDLVQANYFVCRFCLVARLNRKCKTCQKCESCAGVRFLGRGSFQPAGVECIECDAGKARCTICYKLRLQHRACRGCRKCEACADIRFQFGVELCTECGGGSRRLGDSTRRVAVESGPGYEMYYYGTEGRVQDPERRIGIR
ncbi:uncharacterized protein BDR25DRAFT_307184 [Lindgomyces ingoldianus]|uniref:Uncharacterized protein n=1 Tax=Lindgomyces ingoldianus TaxID=673940 RepID=A0ACB6QBW5_9PLEO|nr:uncharacterized protein BDR25DRAFT_307184 [Lindgomyces ingoldianus]KAF2464464.1 hypothetical protein BDR25DRAFT_307184 [Lindgomyces ingoldianus]